jgi:hypothetical protein
VGRGGERRAVRAHRPGVTRWPHQWDKQGEQTERPGEQCGQKPRRRGRATRRSLRSAAFPCGPAESVGAARYTRQNAGRGGVREPEVNGSGLRGAGAVRAEAARRCLPRLPAAPVPRCSGAGETGHGIEAQSASLLHSAWGTRDHGGEKQRAYTTVRSRGPRGFHAEPSTGEYRYPSAPRAPAPLDPMNGRQEGSAQREKRRRREGPVGRADAGAPHAPHWLGSRHLCDRQTSGGMRASRLPNFSRRPATRHGPEGVRAGLQPLVVGRAGGRAHPPPRH